MPSHSSEVIGLAPGAEVAESPQAAEFPGPLLAAAGRATGALRRTLYRVRRDGDELVALGYHRPGTRQHKLTELTGDAELLGELLAAVVDTVGGVLSVKLEFPGAVSQSWREALDRVGFEPLRAPVQAGGLPTTAATPVGFVYRVGGWRSAELPYYRQTTEFSCGPVAVGTALSAQQGSVPLDRAGEIGLWREATSMPACDVHGLVVALAGRGTLPVAAVVSSAEPLFCESGAAWEIDLRRFAQAEFRAAAAAQGLPVEYRWFEVSEVVELVRAGRIVVLLIDELLMHGEVCPHWVVVHGNVDGALLVEDPWTDAEFGESWVDAHELVVDHAALDRMAAWGDPPVRSMLVF